MTQICLLLPLVHFVVSVVADWIVTAQAEDDSLSTNRRSGPLVWTNRRPGKWFSLCCIQGWTRERLRPNKEKAECMKYTGVLVFLLEDEEFEYFDANLIVFTCSYQE